MGNKPRRSMKFGRTADAEDTVAVLDGPLKYNAWFCPTCKGLTVTREPQGLVTPMMLGCRASGSEGTCSGTAHSLWYPPERFFQMLGVREIDTAMSRSSTFDIEWEWYAENTAQAAGNERASLRRVPRMNLEQIEQAAQTRRVNARTLPATRAHAYLVQAEDALDEAVKLAKLYRDQVEDFKAERDAALAEVEGKNRVIDNLHNDIGTLTSELNQATDYVLQQDYKAERDAALAELERLKADRLDIAIQGREARATANALSELVEAADELAKALDAEDGEFTFDEWRDRAQRALDAYLRLREGKAE